MKIATDLKRAASGECGDDAAVVLEPVESLVAALRPSRTQQRTTAPEKRLVEPVKQFDLYTPHIGRLTNVMEEHPMSWVRGMSYTLMDDREIVAWYAQSTPDTCSSMAIDIVEYGQLVKEPIANSTIGLVLERLHPLVYRGHIERARMPDRSAVIEVGFYSRMSGKTANYEGLYLGKTKLYFPKPYRAMNFYLDLSKLR